MQRPSLIQRTMGASLGLALIGGLLAAGGAPTAASPLEPDPEINGLVAETLTAQSFAEPSDVARAQFRYWVPTPPPAGGLDPAVLRGDIEDMAGMGAGGVEVAALGFFGGGPNVTEAWGSQTWARSMNTILQAAEDNGLEVSTTIGPAWPARISTVDSPNDPRASQGLYASSTTVPAGGGPVTATLPQPTGFAPGANPRLVAVMAAQCTASATCAPTTNPGPAGAHRTTLIDRASTRTVATAEAGAPDNDRDNTFTFAPPASASSNAWSVMAFWQATESTPQNGFAGPQYLVDHLSESGASVITDFWDDNILNYGTGEDSTRAIIDRLGGIQLFEDSLELSDRLKWTDTMISEWSSRRGYNPTLSLPALANTGAQSCDTFTPSQSGANNTAAGTGMDCGVPPAFDFSDGSGVDVRRDYRQTFSDLYIENRLGTLTAWGRANNIRLKAQPYGEPIDIAAASTVLDVPEGESLAFVNNPEYYKVVAVGAHMSGANNVSTECCAVFRTPYGIDLDKRLDYVNRAYAGGVTMNTWHGYSYPYAGNARQTWPGNHAFGQIVDEALGKRNPGRDHFAEAMESLNRIQLTLRQGSPRFDVAVYREDFGLTSVQGNGNNLGESQGGTFNEGTVDAPDNPPGSSTVAVKTAMNARGYTYEYVSPEHFELGAARWDGERLFPDRSAYKAMVLNEQSRTMRLDSMQQILAWAKEGLPLVIIGGLPTETPSLSSKQQQSASLQAAARQLAALADDPRYNVRRVGSEAYVPSALEELAVAPAAARARVDPAILPVRRTDAEKDYYYLFNQSGRAVGGEISLEGSGQPYLLDHVTGEIRPVARWSENDGRVTFDARIGAKQAALYVLAPSGLDGVAAPAVTAASSTGDLVGTGDGLAVRTTAAGSVRTTLRGGRVVDTTVAAAPRIELSDTWRLGVESWTPDPDSADTTVTKKTQLPTRPVTVGPDGTLPSWRDVAGVGEKVSGIGTYRQSFDAPAGWRQGVGAYLSLGRVSDTAIVTLNGERVPTDQANLERIDVGPWLVEGENVLEVQVASRLLNAVRATGAAGFATLQPDANGLIGPVRVSAYRQTGLDLSDPTPPVQPPAKSASSAVLSASPRTQLAGRPGAVLSVRVYPAARAAGGRVVFYRDGKAFAAARVGSNGVARVRMPTTNRVGHYRVQSVFEGSAKARRSTSNAIVVRVARTR